MILPSFFQSPAHIHSGERALAKLPSEAAPYGANGIVVHGKAICSGNIRESLDAAMAQAGVTAEFHRHDGGEPTLGEVESLRATIRDRDAKWVMAIGGGSVMDLAKAAAGLATAPESVAAYQGGAPIPPARIPLFAAPSTAGTGSEATIVAVLTDPMRNLKQSIRHQSFMPRAVALDPALLRDCPKSVLAASGMDAITQAFESYTSNKATPFTRALSELALVRLVNALPKAWRGERTDATLSDLLEGSFTAGLALSHARLGVVHGLAHPLGARWHIPHGKACAICLPLAIDFNKDAIASDLAHLEKVFGRPFPQIVDALMREFEIVSPLKGVVLDDDTRAAIIRETLASGSTAANPRPVDAASAAALLDKLIASE